MSNFLFIWTKPPGCLFRHWLLEDRLPACLGKQASCLTQSIADRTRLEASVEAGRDAQHPVPACLGRRASLLVVAELWFASLEGRQPSQTGCLTSFLSGQSPQAVFFGIGSVERGVVLRQLTVVGKVSFRIAMKEVAFS